MRLTCLALFRGFLVACGGRANVQCESDSNCDLSGGGKCVAASSGNEWCAYPDPECPSGYRYSNDDVGDGVGGVCVAGTGVDAGVDAGIDGPPVAVHASPNRLTDASVGELRNVWTQLHHHLLAHDGNVVAAFCEVVRRRRATAAKLVALHLASDATGELLCVVDELVTTDEMLYAHHRGSALMAAAIALRWNHFDIKQREAVVANIAAADGTSPVRDLIAAIPVQHRPTALEARLVELGGPRTPTPVTFEHIVPPATIVPPSLSVAERIKEVPELLAACPIDWDRIRTALYDDERANESDGALRPPRLLTPEIARRCADAAIDAIAGFSSKDASRDDAVVHVADIALAFDPLNADDALNHRLIDVLRGNVFAVPLDIECAVHALMFVRPWHWRLAWGRELLLHITGSIDEPRVTSAVLWPLGYESEDVVREALVYLSSGARSTSGDLANNLGRFLGAFVLWRASLGKLLREWLASPPTMGVLSSEAVWNDFLRGVAFSLKEDAERSRDADATVYRDIAQALWTAWQSPRSRAGSDRHGMALFLMSPLGRRDGFQPTAARFWPALRLLFQDVMTTGDEEDVSCALFQIDLPTFGAVEINELASILAATARSKKDQLPGPGRDDRQRIAQVLGQIALQPTCTREIASEIHQTLILVGARKEVLDVERRWPPL